MGPSTNPSVGGTSIDKQIGELLRANGGGNKVADFRIGCGDIPCSCSLYEGTKTGLFLLQKVPGSEVVRWFKDLDSANALAALFDGGGVDDRDGDTKPSESDLRSKATHLYGDR